MPIYEFKCSKCTEFFELLIFKDKDEICKCPKCGSHEYERILSTAGYTMGFKGKNRSVKTQNRSCSGGSCTTYEIPGPA